MFSKIPKSSASSPYFFAASRLADRSINALVRDTRFTILSFPKHPFRLLSSNTWSNDQMSGSQFRNTNISSDWGRDSTNCTLPYWCDFSRPTRVYTVASILRNFSNSVNDPRGSGTTSKENLDGMSPSRMARGIKG